MLPSNSLELMGMYIPDPDWEWMPLGVCEAGRMNYRVIDRTKFAFETLAENIDEWLREREPTVVLKNKLLANKRAIEEIDRRCNFHRGEKKAYKKQVKLLDVCEFMEKGFAVLTDAG